jgi:hypothetical protein
MMLSLLQKNSILDQIELRKRGKKQQFIQEINSREMKLLQKKNAQRGK